MIIDESNNKQIDILLMKKRGKFKTAGIIALFIIFCLLMIEGFLYWRETTLESSVNSDSRNKPTKPTLPPPPPVTSENTNNL